MRVPLQKSLKLRSVLTLGYKEDIPLPKMRSIMVDSRDDLITKSYQMHYQPSQKRLIAHFSGARGIHTFDIRKNSLLEYYDLHSYPMSTYDVGAETLLDYAISVSSTKEYRYDVRPINLKKAAKDHNRDYCIFPGHKAVITRMRVDGNCIVTGAKNGELKVMKFNLFRGDLSKAPSCINLKN